jgi:hypothetical protein
MSLEAIENEECKCCQSGNNILAFAISKKTRPSIKAQYRIPSTSYALGTHSRTLKRPELDFNFKTTAYMDLK